jgi:hypothetical protein
MSSTKLCPAPSHVQHQAMSSTKPCPTPSYVQHQAMSSTKLCPAPNYVQHQIHLAKNIYSNAQDSVLILISIADNIKPRNLNPP